MKTSLFCFITFVAFLQSAHAQSSMGVENDLKRITAANGSSVAVSTFSNSAVKGNRYLFEDWSPGIVISTTGQLYSANYGFNFDKMAQDVYAKENGSGVTVVLDKTKIRSFKIGTVMFVNSTTLKNTSANVFYQVLVEDTAKTSLYKLTTTKFVKADPNNIMNVRTGNSTSEYVDDISYYISNKGGELKKVGLNESSIRKIMKEKNTKVDAYLSMYETKEVDEAFLVELIRYVNGPSN